MAIYITGNKDVDGFVNKDPFALLVAMVLDQQVPLERAFSAPADLRDRLGGHLDVAEIADMPEDRLAAIFSERPALHRFPGSMAKRVQDVARIVVDEYGGNPAKIWKGAPDGVELFRRVRSLPGFGEQKARIFIALLAKQFGVTPPGWEQEAGPFGKAGSHFSVADIDSAEALLAVRDHKREMKAAAKAAPAPRGKVGARAR